MQTEVQNYNLLKKYALNQGISLFGVADIRSLKENFLTLEKNNLYGLDQAVSLAMQLSSKIIEDINNRPTKLYFHHYRQVNNALDQIALKITTLIQEKGFDAIPIASSQIVDWEKQLAHVSHKHIAAKAGLGWIGRNNLLINKTYGARLRLVSILTDIPLYINQPVTDNCHACRACINICPAQAIKKNQKDFNHLSCFDKLKEFRNKGYVGQYICGICVKACKGTL